MGGVGAPPVCRSGVQNNATSRLIMGYCSMKNNQHDFEPCTLDEAAEALNYVAGDMRDMHIRMGCALKHEFGDDQKLKLEVSMPTHKEAIELVLKTLCEGEGKVINSIDVYISTRRKNEQARM